MALIRIRTALTRRKLMDAYQGRPEYQQNDYIGSRCVTRAKHEETKQKQLVHTCPGCRRRGMLDELEGGRLYMNLKWRSRR